MNLVWKTRRIKGTVVDYALTDMDNDGSKELVVCVNSHPGASGIRQKRTFITAYPLAVQE